MFHQIVPLLETVGYFGMFAMVFAETGLLVGFFFPGDTLLFTAGLLASQGYFNIFILTAGAFLAAVLGDSVGYWIGKKIGPKIFTREDSFFFKHEYIARTQHFFDKHGKKTIVLARFLPIVRTFAPVLAGVGSMEYRSFLFYNVFGAAAWCALVPLLGYFLGNKIPNVDHYLLPIVATIFLISFIPLIREVFRRPKIGS